MSSFTKPLTVTKISGRKWRVERSFKYYLKTELGECVSVPVGFETDFASVPRLFWTLIPPDGLYTQAAVVHDYTYFKKLYKRSKCDRIFLDAMRVLGVPWYKRYTMYWAVRVGAWVGWNKHRSRET